ncbi:hypothetical protein RvY_04742 [Ramazzottius varieornatus]|uniref:Uncharacterized protein n=1 Tax=Ramazzottius varieornatus TaxID=947166 RepID=A0A1D1V1U3_RAMVA|nr:hypothetical protein RvY_04742 [Ramazzottius varieornatus]
MPSSLATHSSTHTDMHTWTLLHPENFTGIPQSSRSMAIRSKHHRARHCWPVSSSQAVYAILCPPSCPHSPACHSQAIHMAGCPVVSRPVHHMLRSHLIGTVMPTTTEYPTSVHREVSIKRSSPIKHKVSTTNFLNGC